ncbi:MAG: response regulator [Microcystaceae cyanobacterium]
MEPLRLVLIEDDELVCLGLKKALTQEPGIIWLGEAHRCDQGLRLIEATRPDLAIVDLGLPDGDGIALTKQIKALPGNEIKVLILTLNSQEEAVLAAFSAGADSYCMKDIRLDLLLEALKATQAGHAWIDPAIARIVLAHTQPIEKLPEKTSEKTSEALTNNYSLTERELEVLQLIVNGHSNAAIAEQLFITVGTVKTHVRNILNKLCADDRTQAAVHALRSGLVG